MSIVQHCTPFSYSLLPPHPLLAAPPVYPALPAPKVSGLLAAPKLVIRVEKRNRLDDLIARIGPIRTVEEMNAEIDELADRLGGNARPMWEAIKAGINAGRARHAR